jgi:hypothetical protein
MRNLAAVIKEFETIATNHAFINRFGNGPIDDVNTTIPNDGKYPVLWVIPQSVLLDDNSIVYNIRILVFDIDSTDDSLRDQILSDTLMTLNDVVKLFRNGGPSNDYEVNQVPQALPFEQEFVDYCVGWYTDLQIATDGMNSPCDFPI